MLKRKLHSTFDSKMFGLWDGQLNMRLLRRIKPRETRNTDLKGMIVDRIVRYLILNGFRETLTGGS